MNDNLKVQYREMLVEDHPSVHDIRMSVIENVLTDPSRAPYEEFVDYLTGVGNGWVAEIGSEMVGFSMANKSGLIWALFVKPGYEGRGIGRQLLDLCMDWLKARGLERAFLDTGSGTRAEKLYRRYGWEEIGRHANGKIDFEMKL